MKSLEEVVKEAFDQMLPVPFTEQGIKAIEEVVRKAVVDELLTVRKICKPHRWIGFGDSVCSDCEDLGTDYMEDA